jgi:hypothetical protein
MEFEEFETLKESGAMTSDVYEKIVRDHFFQSENDDHLDSCDLCQCVSWFDHLFGAEEDLEYVSADLMQWLLERVDGSSYGILETASKVANARGSWIDSLLPEYWPDYVDLLVDSDTTVRTKLDWWSKNPNCTKRMIENYIKNVHEIRNSNPEMTSKDGDGEVIYDKDLTCIAIDDIEKCISCQTLAMRYGVELTPPYHWPFSD